MGEVGHKNQMCGNPQFGPDVNTWLGTNKNIRKAPPRITCHTCGRRMKPIVFDCEEGMGPLCLHLKMPQHKVKGWWKKSKKIKKKK